MAVDTPARIAILGAGPIGLEAALYARFLGYDVLGFDRGAAAQNVLDWGHVKMFSPFGMNRSELGLAALTAQDEAYCPPADDEILTGRQWAEQYLIPLANTDLLAGRFQTHTRVRSVSRASLLKGDAPGRPERRETPFRILVEGPDGVEAEHSADVVIDATGTFGHPNGLGPGGGPARGEARARPHIETGIPDLESSDRSAYAGRHVLLVGSGYSAATSAVALAGLVASGCGTRVTWVTRRAREEGSPPGPLCEIAEDRLAERARLASRANQAVARGAITHWDGTWIGAVHHDAAEDVFQVELRGRHEGRFSFDRVIANVGYRPDKTLYRELQVHECYASEGPMKLAAALLGSDAQDCLDQQPHGPSSLTVPEPDFYILGAKSYGRQSRFLVSIGLVQIRDLFTIIWGREDLDLYQRALSMPRGTAKTSRAS